MNHVCDLCGDEGEEIWADVACFHAELSTHNQFATELCALFLLCTSLTIAFDSDAKLLQFAIERGTRVMKNPGTEFDVAGSARERLHDCFTLYLLDRDQRWNYEMHVTQVFVLQLVRQTFGYEFFT